ncbi:MAG: hypothetical protein R3A44_10300 [Caldilineaceae bacterium]
MLQAAAKEADPDEITVLDAGFHLPGDSSGGTRALCGAHGRQLHGARIVYPSTKDVGHARNTGLDLARWRKHSGRTIAASQAQQQGRFAYKGRTIRYHIWPQLVTVNTKVDEDNPTFTLMLFFDPLYKKPMILATDLPLDAEAIYHIYRDAGLSSIPLGRQTDDWLASSIRLCRGLLLSFA